MTSELDRMEELLLRMRGGVTARETRGWEADGELVVGFLCDTTT